MVSQTFKLCRTMPNRAYNLAKSIPSFVCLSFTNESAGALCFARNSTWKLPAGKISPKHFSTNVLNVLMYKCFRKTTVTRAEVRKEKKW